MSFLNNVAGHSLFHGLYLFDVGSCLVPVRSYPAELLQGLFKL